MTATDSYNFGMSQVSYPQSCFSHQPQPERHNPQRTTQGPQVHPFHSSLPNPHQSLFVASHQPHALTEMFHQDPISRLQGLDISSRGTEIKPEGSSISVSESSSTFWPNFFANLCFDLPVKRWLVHRLTLLTEIFFPHLYVVLRSFLH